MVLEEAGRRGGPQSNMTELGAGLAPRRAMFGEPGLIVAGMASSAPSDIRIVDKALHCSGSKAITLDEIPAETV